MYDFSDLGFTYVKETDQMWRHGELNSDDGHYGFFITHPNENEWYLSYVTYNTIGEGRLEKRKEFNSLEKLVKYIKE